MTTGYNTQADLERLTLPAFKQTWDKNMEKTYSFPAWYNKTNGIISKLQTSPTLHAGQLKSRSRLEVFDMICI